MAILSVCLSIRPNTLNCDPALLLDRALYPQHPTGLPCMSCRSGSRMLHRSSLSTGVEGCRVREAPESRLLRQACECVRQLSLLLPELCWEAGQRTLRHRIWPRNRPCTANSARAETRLEQVHGHHTNVRECHLSA